MKNTILKYTDLTTEQQLYVKTYVYNGLGSKELGVILPEFIFKDAAIEHDFDSFSGGTDEDRKKADLKFFKNCKNLIEESNCTSYYYIIYSSIAYIYYLGLLCFSRLTWDYYPEPAKTWEEFIKRVNCSKKTT